MPSLLSPAARDTILAKVNAQIAANGCKVLGPASPPVQAYAPPTYRPAPRPNMATRRKNLANLTAWVNSRLDWASGMATDAEAEAFRLKSADTVHGWMLSLGECGPTAPRLRGLDANDLEAAALRLVRQAPALASQGLGVAA